MLPESKCIGVNQLASEGSAYLRQHAGNPVPWWAWGESAIDDARRRDVPLLVSIGYSTCHWCHVMEHECFMHADIAAIMGEHFTCVKVDREARPDLDSVWMTTCQVFTALTEGHPSGGWPLHVFLDPQTLRPFFAGTYFPPTPGMGRIAFPELLQGLSNAWKNKRAEVQAQGDEIARLVKAEMELAQSRRPLDAAVHAQAAQALVRFHDRVHGGFGGAPKFPQPSLLRFLQSCAQDAAAQMVVRRTLECMARGGVRDQLDGGFHRYAVDASWTVPHFEKMLYDQGQLLSVYAAHVRTNPQDAWLAQVTNELADFMLASMRDASDKQSANEMHGSHNMPNATAPLAAQKTTTAPQPHAAFIAAIDADAAGKEGTFHLWNPEHMEEALQRAGCAELLPLALRTFGLQSPANFRDPHHPLDAPSWVLTLSEQPEMTAKSAEISLNNFHAAMRRVREVLLHYREIRPHPFVDDGVIAAWNGLAIEGLAEASIAVGRPELAQAAADAATSVSALLRMPDGTLARSWRNGVVTGSAYLEDLACFSLGLLALHRATKLEAWLALAKQTLSQAITQCWSDSDGWLEAPADALGRFTQVGGVEDGAVPSGAGAVSEALVACAMQSGEFHWADAAFAGLDRASGTIAERPTSSPRSLLAAAALRVLQPNRIPGGQPAGPVCAQLVALDHGGENFELQIMIAKGHHVNAHDVGVPTLIGLTATARDVGVRIEVAWPQGELHHGGARVHHGGAADDAIVRVPIRLLVPQPAPRPLRLEIGWQCCTDSQCLPPQQTQVEA